MMAGRHTCWVMMKKLVPLLLLAGSALAQEPDRSVEADRVRSVIAEINKALSRSDASALSQFFTQDGDFRMGQVVATGRTAIARAIERQRSVIWSEVTPPVIETESVRFVSPEVAVVDGSQVQYGSVILKRILPIVLLMKLDGTEWRVVSMRVLLSQPIQSSPLPMSPR